MWMRREGGIRSDAIAQDGVAVQTTPGIEHNNYGRDRFQVPSGRAKRVISS